MNIYYVAAIWLGMALLASVVSIRIAVPAALVEIVVGALAGNIPGIREHVTQTGVVVFLASVGSLVLTFLAGAEIDPVSLRGHWKASLFASYGWLLLVFVAVSAVTVAVLPRLLRLAIKYFGHRSPNRRSSCCWWSCSRLAGWPPRRAVRRSCPPTSPGWSWRGYSCTTGC